MSLLSPIIGAVNASWDAGLRREKATAVPGGQINNFREQ